MGYEGVKTIVAVLNNESYEKKVDTGVKLVTPDNINETDVQELINPDLDKWLNQ
jgi:ribose transport system substrate-binding protein